MIMRGNRVRSIHLVVMLALAVLGPAIVLMRDHTTEDTSRPVVVFHDFGEVLLVDNQAATLHHTFRLFNSWSRPIEIKSIESTCGCTDIRATQGPIEPGEAYRVDATFTLTEAGRKTSSISLDLGAAGTQRIEISAIGRKDHAFGSMEAGIEFDSKNRDRIELYYTSIHQQLPPAPSIDAPDHIRFYFDEWVKIIDMDESARRPARWQGMLELELTKPSLSSRQMDLVTIQMPDSDPISLPVLQQTAIRVAGESSQ